MFKRLILICVLASTCVHADYDPRDDPNSPQNRAAAQKARKAAAEAKVKSDAVKAERKLYAEKVVVAEYRVIMKDRAKGMTDAQVTAAYPAFIKEETSRTNKTAADAYRQLLGEKTKGLSDAQVIALMSDPKAQKEIHDQQQAKIVQAQTQFANMSASERAMFERNSGMTVEQMQKILQQGAAAKK